MFKSVFTKYVTAFMLIILISFIILGLITSTLLMQYSTDIRYDEVTRISFATTKYIQSTYSEYGNGSFTQYIQNAKELGIKNAIASVSNFSSEITVFIVDNEGKVLINIPENTTEISKDSLPMSIIKTFSQEQEPYLSNFSGFLNDTCLVCPSVIYEQDGITEGGYVVICSYSTSLVQLSKSLVKTIIMVTLWVMLAALIAVYFISERIIGPLKAMSRAAKMFASGKFDVRVPVLGGQDEVAELAAAFNSMADSMQNLENMRRTFLANVSHDLRTPMTTISGFIDGILDGAIPKEKHEYYLNIIATEVKRLSRLVTSLLDISRIQAGERKFNMEVFDICEMARQILISFEQKIDEKKLDVEFDCEDDTICVNADHDAIYQIFYNICDNAVKFSRPEGKYRIGIHVKDKKAVISVYNEGKGIAYEDQPYVFERFYKSDKSRGLDKTGVGLGLYIAKSIIDAHQEEIFLNSVPGEFCEFVFTLEHAHEIPAKTTENTK